MRFIATDEFRSKKSKDGSMLKGIRCVGGGALGMIAGGIVLLFFPGLIGIPMIFSGDFLIALIGVILVAPGLILVILGIILRKRRIKNYLDYFQKETAFTLEELAQVDAELMSDNMLIIGNRMPEQGKNAAFYYCYITPHYFVMPHVTGSCQLRRIEEILAVAYSKRIPGIDGYKYGLVLLSAQDERMTKKDEPPGVYNAFLTKESCLEVIEEIARRNPSVITDEMFQYQNRVYDILKDGREIIQLQLAHKGQ